MKKSKLLLKKIRMARKGQGLRRLKKYMPPNPTAQAFWLKNRKRDEWGERKEIIFDTKTQELERKKLFLQMINDEVVEADYSVADMPNDEPIIEEEI